MVPELSDTQASTGHTAPEPVGAAPQAGAAEPTLLPLSDTCLSDTCPCKAGGEPPTEEEPQINESKQPIIVRLPHLEHDSTVELDGYWNSSLGPTSVAVRGRIATFNHAYCALIY